MTRASVGEILIKKRNYPILSMQIHKMFTKLLRSCCFTSARIDVFKIFRLNCFRYGNRTPAEKRTDLELSVLLCSTMGRNKIIPVVVPVKYVSNINQVNSNKAYFRHPFSAQPLRKYPEGAAESGQTIVAAIGDNAVLYIFMNDPLTVISTGISGNSAGRVQSGHI